MHCSDFLRWCEFENSVPDESTCIFSPGGTGVEMPHPNRNTSARKNHHRGEKRRQKCPRKGETDTLSTQPFSQRVLKGVKRDKLGFPTEKSNKCSFNSSIFQKIK